MANILIITYSQSGQLDSIVDNVTGPLAKSHTVHRVRIEPAEPYPFPWTNLDFYDAMPECVEMIPGHIRPMKLRTDIRYDLVIIGYPIWFLSPPIPLTTFLKSDMAGILKGKPVLTVIGARNMWVNAQEDVKRMIADQGGHHVGNIALTDRHNNLISVVTIIYWMMTGKKDRLWNIFPIPGIREKDIEEADRFSVPLKSALDNGQWEGLQDSLIALGAVRLDANVVSTENKGKKIFRIWSSFIRRKGGPKDPARRTRLVMFKYYLLFVIFVVSPIVSLFFYLTWPLFHRRIRNQIKYYQSVSLR